MPLRVVVLAFLLAAVVAPARAERYCVHLGTLPPVFVDDAAGYVSQLNRSQDSMTAPGLPAPAATAPQPPAILTPSPIETGASGADPVAAAPSLSMPVGLDEAIQPPSSGPTPRFAQALAGTYGMPEPAAAAGAWSWYLQEPSDLNEAERIANAVIRFITANSWTGPSSAANPAGLKPDATRGTIQATNGVFLHVAPWGPTTVLAGAGTTLELVPPAQGPWYRVRSGGWICGLWLALQ